MGFFDGVKSFFKNGFSGAYNAAKDIVGKVYSPIHSAVSTVGEVANKINHFVNEARNSNSAVISNIAKIVGDNPIYKGAMGAVQTAQDVDSTARQIGSKIDDVVNPLADSLDKGFKMGQYKSQVQRNGFPMG